MILKASKRTGAGPLAKHLLNEEDNEHVELHELRGFSSDNLSGALKEIEAVSKGTRCQQYLFSLSLSPPGEESVAVQVFEKAIERIEKKLGLEGQPRAVVFHEKEGRRHAHCVWSRIDAEEMKAIDMPYFKMKLRDLSKELYLEHGWKLPRGLLDSKQRDPENFSLAEWQQAKRQNEDPKALKAMFQECWSSSDNKQSLTQALEDRGFYLAAGDQRGFVAVDFHGEVFSLSKWMGVKANELVTRLGNASSLPSVSETKSSLAARMTKTLENHQKTVRNQVRGEAEPILRERMAMREKHRQERDRMKEFQEQRHIKETKARAENLPKGIKGLWHRLTGSYQRMKSENEKAAQQAKDRDRAQKQLMIETQMKERRALQQQLQALRQEHKIVLQTLREDTAYYLRLGKEAAERPRAEFQKAGDRFQARTLDKSRGKEM